MINVLDKFKIIFFKPFNLILSTVVSIYFIKIFKKDLMDSPEYNESSYLEDMFGYLKKYSNEITLYAQEWSDKLFIIKYIFSIIFWSLIYQLIYLFIK